MNKKESLKKFAEYRALGYTYDEIVKKLGVSKVTLLRWNKKYFDLIDSVKKEMVRSVSENIALRNSSWLIKFSDLVLSEYRKGKNKPDIDEIFMKKFYRNVFLVYSRKMKSLAVNFDVEGTPRNVTIEWKD